MITFAPLDTVQAAMGPDIGKNAAMAGYRKAAQRASAALPVSDLTISTLKRPATFLPR